jgi:tRNA U34 5-carboxymethylaminomethyl modifying GTPase MnmE/TrmE
MINKYLTSDEVQKLQSLENSLDTNEVNINCVGLYNHGKSSLLNVLIGDFEDQTFKTADVRETAVSKSLKVGNIIYTDTPGLNANENDDEVVMKSIVNSDVNLFVHTITTGEFSKAEVDFLHKLKTYWKNPEEFIDQTVFVLSRIDKAEDEFVITETASRMQQQLKEIFGVSLSKIVPVSATRYAKGKREDKQIFVKKSGIPKLENAINNIVFESEESIKKTKVERLEKYREELTQKLYKKLAKNKQKLEQAVQKESEFEKNFQQDISRIEETLKNKYSQL